MAWGDPVALSSDSLKKWLTEASRALSEAGEYIDKRDRMAAQYTVFKRRLAGRKETGTAVLVAVLIIVISGLPLTLLLYFLPGTAFFIGLRVVLALSLLGSAPFLFRKMRKALRPAEAKKAEALLAMIHQKDAEWNAFLAANEAAVDAARALPQAYRSPAAAAQMLEYVNIGWATDWIGLTVLYSERNRKTEAEAGKGKSVWQVEQDLWWEQLWRGELEE